MWTSPNKPSNTITNGEQQIKRKPYKTAQTRPRSPIMANIINDQDLQGHISPATKMGSIENLAKLFRNRYGTFSDAEGENITIFAKNADDFMTQNMIPSLEMGTIVVQNLRKEPYTRAKRWRDTMTVDPEKINADHWTEQPYQAATPFMPFQPMQMAQDMIPARPAGIDIHGNPDPNDPGHPGQPQIPFIGMRPPIPAVRKQVAVNMNYCLKAYLLHAFQKKVDITAAEKFLNTFKRQQPKQTCSNFIDVFMVKFEHYVTLRWTVDESDAPNFRENVNTIRLQYIREGLCREFKKHLDSNPQVVTLQQVDDEIQRWARETIEGQDFTRNCNKPKAHHPLIIERFDNIVAQDRDNPDITESYPPTSTRQKLKDVTTRDRGSGTRGGRTLNNNERNISTDRRQPKLYKQPQDVNNTNNCDQHNNGSLQLLLSTLKTIGETFIRIGTWITQKSTPEDQQVQRPTIQPDAPAPITFTITNPEDARWVAQMRSSGLDPAMVITTYRQNQQHLDRTQTPQIPTPFISRSPYSNCNTPPSEYGACNECGHTSPGLPPINGHQKGALHRLPDGPDNNNYHSLVLPSGLVVCIECEHITSSFEMADRHQKETHSGQGSRNQTTRVQTPRKLTSIMPSGLLACNDGIHTSSSPWTTEKHQKEIHSEQDSQDQTSHVQTSASLLPATVSALPPFTSAALLPSTLVACNDCGQVFPNFKSADRHRQETHPRLANGPDRHN